MSAKQTTKAAAPAAEKKSPPPARKQVQVRVKTTATGVKRQVCGVILTNEWQTLTLDDRGSAYKAIERDHALVMEAAPIEKAAN
ncbi:hypothetical protein [Vreelandella sp. EE27]